jgi:hypothetical protein
MYYMMNFFINRYTPPFLYVDWIPFMRGLPRDAAQQWLEGTQLEFQMSTTRLLEKCSTAGAAKGVDLTVERYYY